MIKHKVFLALTLLQIMVLSVLFTYGHIMVSRRNRGELPARRELVRHLQLTDLSLWTEARYARHPSQADFFSAFQDFPSALEHFPAGSIIGPENLLSTQFARPGRH